VAEKSTAFHSVDELREFMDHDFAGKKSEVFQAVKILSYVEYDLLPIQDLTCSRQLKRRCHIRTHSLSVDTVRNVVSMLSM
jgi:hypothetical protein